METPKTDAELIHEALNGSEPAKVNGQGEYAPIPLADGGTLFPLDFHEYIRYMEAAPPGTFIKIGDPILVPQLMQCTVCGAQMDKAFTAAHERVCNDAGSL